MRDDVPEGWSSTTVRSLFECWGGMTPSTAKDAYWGGDVAWVSSKDIKSAFLDRTSESITKKALAETRLRVCRPGTVLVVVRSGVLAHTLPVAVTRREVVVNQDVKALDSGSDELNEWLAAYLRADQQNILEENRKDGTTVQSIRVDQLLERTLPIPPLAEQKRIVEKVDALLADLNRVRDRLAKVSSILKRFRQSVLTAATSGELTTEWPEGRGIRREWREATLGSLLTDVRYGTSKKCAYEPSKTPVLRIPNVAGGAVNHDDMKYADFDKDEMAKLALVPGDLLMIRSNGSVGLVGRTALVSERESGFAYAGYLIRLRSDTTQASPAYLSLFLASPASRSRIELTARSTTGVNNINTEEIRAFPVDLPSLDEQHEIVRRVGELFAMADRLDARVLSAQAVVQRTTPSVLARAFRGDLVPQDRNDEHAADLLARMRSRPATSSGPIKPKRGGARGPRKTTTATREKAATMKKLIDVLAEAGDWMTAQDAFRSCGIREGATTELVESIYAELRELERAKHVAVEPIRDARGRKVHDRLKLITRP